MPAYRFWRLRIDRAGGDVSCQTFRLFSDYDATVEVLGGTTTANSVWYGEAYDGAKTRDGDPNTMWASTHNPSGSWPVDLVVDFGEGNEQSIAAFSYQARTDSYYGQAMLSGGLEFSSNGTDYTRYIQADTDGWTMGETKTWRGPPPEPTQAVRAAIPFSGDNITLMVAAGTSSIRARLFGAGGAGGRYAGGRFGGGGGYTEVEWPVAEGDEIIVQVPQGGQQAEPGGWSAGGWPDGGSGAPGDTTPGGGGGSARLWINGELIAVAGGGGGAAGYSYWGGAGGGLAGGSENPWPASQTAPGREGDPVRAGRSIAEAGLNGPTGGPGGSGGGDDGAGGGGGYFGGGGGGGDGNAGGGGSGYVAPDPVYGYTASSAHGAHSSGGAWSSDFIEGVGYGSESNTQEPGGNGLAVLYSETALLGDAPEVPEPSAIVANVEAQVVYRTHDGPVSTTHLTSEVAYLQTVRPARVSQAFADLAYDVVIRPAKVSNAYIEVMRSLRIPKPRRRGLHIVNEF